MKRVVLAVVSTVAALVLVLSYKTHSPSAVATPPAAVSTKSTTQGPTPSATTKAPRTQTHTTKTYTGSAANTAYGPVQVQITVTSGHVTNARAVVYPTSYPRDQQINSYAIPQLNAEATAASSARIDMVSGATFTSEGYIASLQSALDQAGL